MGVHALITPQPERSVTRLQQTLVAVLTQAFLLALDLIPASIAVSHLGLKELALALLTLAQAAVQVACVFRDTQEIPARLV